MTSMMPQTLKQHIGYWVNRLRTYVHQAFEQRLEAYDVTVAQWCILVAMYDRQAASINELARYIEVDKASVSRVVERLVAKGWVEHHPGKDRRSGCLELTPEGQRLVPLLITEAEHNEQHFFGPLTGAERVQFQNLFRKILTIIPSATLDGWLASQENTMTPTDQIEHIMSQSKEMRWPYPKTFDALKEAGVTSYEVKLANYDAAYFGTFGEFKESPPEGFQPLKVADSFSKKAVMESLARHQQSKTDYLQWVAEAAAAGVSHYRVDMKERTVTYYGKDGQNSHQERVPQG